MRRWIALVLLMIPAAALAQPNGVLLVAKPALRDPNFAQAVVLVTRSADGGTVGVILNRPSERRHAGHVVYAGGPVLQQVIVALYESDSEPQAAAFTVLPNVYLTMHPKNVDALVAQPATRMRLFAGFSGWAPRQLEAEIDVGGWYVMRATPALVFRTDTSGMWNELVEQAGGARTSLERRDILVP